MQNGAQTVAYDAHKAGSAAGRKAGSCSRNRDRGSSGDAMTMAMTM